MIIEQKDQLRKQILQVLPTYPPNIPLYFKEKKPTTKQQMLRGQLQQPRLRFPCTVILIYGGQPDKCRHSFSYTGKVSQQSATKDLILPGFYFSCKIPHYYYYSTSVIQCLSSQCVQAGNLHEKKQVKSLIVKT